MKIFISSDMEGTAGVVDWDQCRPGQQEYEHYRRLLQDEVNAAIDGLKAGTVRPTPQPASGITYAPRIEREQGRLDWRRSATELDRVVRAFAPAPGAYSTLAGRLLKVYRAREVAERSAALPGTVVRANASEGIVVATGAGSLGLLEVQLEGRRRLDAAAFLAGQQVAPGTCLGA